MSEPFDYPKMSRALIIGDKDTVAAKTREGLSLAMDPRTSSSGPHPGYGRRRREVPTHEYYVPRCCSLRGRCTPGSISSSRSSPRPPRATTTRHRRDRHRAGRPARHRQNLVAMMLEGAGFKVVNLGRDVAPEKFVAAVEEHNANIVGSPR